MSEEKDEKEVAKEKAEKAKKKALLREREAEQELVDAREAEALERFFPRDSFTHEDDEDHDGFTMVLAPGLIHTS